MLNIFRKNEKNRSVSCGTSVLFEIIQEDLHLGICCDITFKFRNKKHMIGVWGDDGNTYKNLHFYFDKEEYQTFEALKNNAEIEGVLLCNIEEDILVLECDGCYPKETELLRKQVK